MYIGLGLLPMRPSPRPFPNTPTHQKNSPTQMERKKIKSPPRRESKANLPRIQTKYSNPLHPLSQMGVENAESQRIPH